MQPNYLQKCLFVLVAGGVIMGLAANNGHAIPSFARQTGMSCNACHTAWPELTPFGRTFKLGGYIFSKASESAPYQPPIAAMFKASYTLINKNNGILNNGVAPFDDPEDSERDKANVPQEAAVYYGGKIIDHMGMFTHVIYDGLANDLALDLTDFRYTRTSSIGGSHLIYGLTINNAPSVEDAWNTTPVWGFPYAASDVAPTPAAAALIDGGLDQQVGGIGLYAFWHNLIYAAATVYRTTADGIARPLGAGTTVTTETDGAVPYWRVALQHDWGRNSAEVGTYGLYADVYPSAMDQGDTNSFTDVGVDAQYQYMSSPHFFSIRGTWIYEKQEWDASYDLGLTANRNSNMDVYKANINYFYQSSCGIFGGSVGYFYSDGDTDVLLYAADPVDGSRNGSPDSNGFIVEADYIFKEKYKLALQYTIYNKFNGSDSNYDGFGRDASDNNTFYALLWLMF